MQLPSIILFMIYLQYLLPHRLVNKFSKLIGNCQIPWVKQFLINYFIKKYSIHLHDVLIKDLHAYKNYNEFFTRKLQPEARNIDQNKNIIVSPCDGYITQYGNIESNMLINTKGCNLNLPNLLTKQNNFLSESEINNFIGGKFINIYLAPHNYHRIHMPFNAKLQQMIYVPGKLYSVSPAVVKKIDNVFTRNERVVCIFNSEIGKIIIILVGAMVVGSIVTNWHGEVTNSPNQTINTWSYLDQNIYLEKGAELGYFQLGSTVIMFCENKQLHFLDNIQKEGSIRMGQKILRNHQI